MMNPNLVRRWVTVALAATLAAGAWPVRPVAAEPKTEITIERVKPAKKPIATLRFLQENRSFIRSRLDLLREKLRAGRGPAEEIDPRFLEYQAMLARIHAAGDSVALAADARERQRLLASIAELAGLESDLDRMERLLAGQRERLGVIQEDFTGDQRTALVVVVRGDAAAAPVSSIALTLEDGSRRAVDLTPEQRAALAKGGVVEVFHGFVEPRGQVLEIGIAGDAWPAGDTGWLRLEPARDRLTFLELDLSTVEPARGAASIRANTWLHDAKLTSRGG